MFLKEFEDSLSKYLEEKIELTIGEIAVSDNEEMIFSTKLKSGMRFIKEYYIEKINFISTLNKGLDILCYGTLTEFPHCCGKAILNNIRLSGNYYKRDEENKVTDYIEYNNDQINYILNITLKLVHDICKNAKYSSVDFIISQHEQPSLYEYLGRIGYKPIYSFKNHRMHGKNICHNYTMEIKYD